MSQANGSSQNAASCISIGDSVPSHKAERIAASPHMGFYRPPRNSDDIIPFKCKASDGNQ